ncbi:hypothetical protein ACVIHI_003221 [Bradyrhizobium sp. USDA 4524]|nr:MULTISPECIES: hypothetical protein [Bradyrhizobium]MCP1843860.1 hypothetical protein [Bradyrhizobium sp. USDA 4538]MCP1904426.1 hypothetical protein [Bradyrhizobium sp. USDA 4537]MCP1989918.1 hypothetical protein [Bradyrhizobium sp. USDA 4539]
MVVFSVLFLIAVIPGRAQREPGTQKLWREIPGSMLRIAPE